MSIPPAEKWGPYVSERGWGTVREDYSDNGDAWNFFTHDHARKRAFRSAEDAIAGISDRFQVLLFAPVFWNGVDPILKERLFGLNSSEGNHGEDVKEYYYHLDATPDHSYLKYLYKYPQSPFPYEQLIQENGNRSASEPEFELMETGIFENDRYFDIFIEYAKAGPDDICIRIEAFNRADVAAPLHILPQLWFRNQWAHGEKRLSEPTIEWEGDCLVADDAQLASPEYLLFDYHIGRRFLFVPPNGKPLFTNNETNRSALWGEEANDTPYVKDAFHRCLIEGQEEAVNPSLTGTKAAVHYSLEIEPHKSAVLLLRLTDRKIEEPLSQVNSIIAEKRREADRFYEGVHPSSATPEEKMIQRQALSGMIWNKQIYIFEMGNWLKEHPHGSVRNVHWGHIISYRIMSMPDKWEYPWFAAWDLTFHTLSFALIDIPFAKEQLWMLLFDQFQHPNGAIPAYEWEFGDVNPPIQAWAALKIFEYEKKKTGREDYAYLEKCFHKLLLNFSWWINKVDALGNNIFEGGFLGMDNIGMAELIPKDIMIDQTDGAGWISLLCLNLMRIALTLAKKNPIYEGLGIKFFQHFVHVSASFRGNSRTYDLWNEKEGFFYTHLHFLDGATEEVRLRTAAGLIPFFACDVWDENELKQFPDFYVSYQWFMQKRPDITSKCVQEISSGSERRLLFGLLNMNELQRLLTHVWDPHEFRSDHGLRSMSKHHLNHPVNVQGFTMRYEPGDSLERVKGGNSNWRGPVWFPINYFLIDTLSRVGSVFKDTLKIKVGNEPPVTLDEMASSFAESLLNLFKEDAQGRRPIFGEVEKFQKDPHFRNYILFYEYFHGDTGRGLGASHQTGWTGLIANLLDELRSRKQ